MLATIAITVVDIKNLGYEKPRGCRLGSEENMERRLKE
jgi:hypothetical protein